MVDWLIEFGGLGGEEVGGRACGCWRLEDRELRSLEVGGAEEDR